MAEKKKGRSIPVEEVFPEGAVIMATEPCQLSPEEVLELYENDKSEAMLAKCLAAASNQTGWLGHDLDDEDCTEFMREQFEAWWKLYQQLVADIKDILIDENNNGMNHVVENIGHHYMVKPVMERNGYRDGCGWWVLKDE